MKRCEWCGEDELYIAYHDREWGVPVYDERTLFEMLCLEGQQAGLSWYTILKKRENYRQAFANFDAQVLANYDDAKIAELSEDTGIIRSRQKIEGIVRNAHALLQMRENGEDFVSFLWDFIGGQPRQNRFETLAQVPAETKESLEMEKALKRRGFTYVGGKICYAFMQAVGMVNDHTTDCFRHSEIMKLESSRKAVEN